jgi:hypothetical protein
VARITGVSHQCPAHCDKFSIIANSYVVGQLPAGCRRSYYYIFFIILIGSVVMLSPFSQVKKNLKEFA